MQFSVNHPEEVAALARSWVLLGFASMRALAGARLNLGSVAKRRSRCCSSHASGGGVPTHPTYSDTFGHSTLADYNGGHANSGGNHTNGGGAGEGDQAGEEEEGLK